MTERTYGKVFLAAAAATALAFRLPRLSERPMHTDEAVQAIKAGELASTGAYIYDPSEYHGPTLPYLTQPFLWCFAGGELARADEKTLRLLPALFGVGTILLTFLVADALSWKGATCAAWLTALSPAMVFYNRYYIHETLLVFFTFLMLGAGWRYLKTGSAGWAALAIAAAALCQATKETCVIVFAAAGVALALAKWGPFTPSGAFDIKGWPPQRRTLAIAAAAALSVWFLLFSSFFTNPRGLVDSFLTYFNYIGRAGGEGLHEHPWYYYLKLLLFTKYGRAPAWTEGFILALACAGGVATFRGHPPHVGFARFLTFFTTLLIAGYSAIPYKTPWCVLGPLHACILLAGIGASWLIEMACQRGGRWAVLLQALAIACLAAGCAHLGLQAYRASFVFSSDRRNPYVYAHTTPDFVRAARRIEDLASSHPEGSQMLVKVIAQDPWPLPWYLRRMERVGYWSDPKEALEPPEAPVVVSSLENAPIVEEHLGKGYLSEYYSQRPEVHVVLFIERTLWEEFLRRRSAQ